MKISMNKDVQSVILAVHRFRAWLFIDAEVRKTTPDFCEVRNYYNSLPKPFGMDSSIACFEAVLCYPIKDTENTEENDLHVFEFGY